jgi:hypothetical protein
MATDVVTIPPQPQNANKLCATVGLFGITCPQIFEKVHIFLRSLVQL